jgi:hypothetical protein
MIGFASGTLPNLLRLSRAAKKVQALAAVKLAHYGVLKSATAVFQ